MIKRFKRPLIIIFSIILVFIIIFISTVEIEASRAKSSIEEFINRGELVCTEDSTEYYLVRKEYDYENTDLRIVDTYNDGLVGTIGDIYFTDTDFGSNFVTKYICKKLRVGHCAVVASPNAEFNYEIVGNVNKKDNIVKIYENDWQYLVNFHEYIAVRVKGMDADKQNKLILQLQKMEGSPYNFFVFAHMKNRYYCTDMATYAYKAAFDININKFFVSTGASMISNDNTYLIYYKREVNKGDIKYQVYFLGE